MMTGPTARASQGAQNVTRKRSASTAAQSALVFAICVATAVAAPAATPAGGAQETVARLDGSSIGLVEVERRVLTVKEDGFVPGLAMAVVQDGETLVTRTFGVKDAGTGEPLRPETNFAGLSFSKPVFAYLVLRLADRGVIDLDRPLHEYLPRPLPDYDFYRDLEGDELHRRITARHALTHTTGWPNWRWFTEEGRLQFSYEPGERFSYSGEGFRYLQTVVEEIAGRGLNELAHDEVFAPLGMARSSFVWEERFADDYASDHDRYLQPRPRPRRAEANAAGSLQTTAGDFARFVVAVMEGRGLSPEAHREMLSPQVAVEHRRMFGPGSRERTGEHRASGLSWGLGWGLVSSPYGRAFFHTGNDVGSANYAVAFPERGIALVLMGNSNRLEGIASAIARRVIGDEYSPFEFLGYVPDTTAEEDSDEGD